MDAAASITKTRMADAFAQAFRRAWERDQQVLETEFSEEMLDRTYQQICDGADPHKVGGSPAAHHYMRRMFDYQRLFGFAINVRGHITRDARTGQMSLNF